MINTEENIELGNSSSTPKVKEVSFNIEEMNTGPFVKSNQAMTSGLYLDDEYDRDSIDKQVAFMQNLSKAAGVAGESFKENALKATMKTKTYFGNLKAEAASLFSGENIDYDKSLAYQHALKSEDPVVVEKAKKKAEDAQALRKVYEKEYSYDESIQKQNDLNTLALHRGAQQAILESIDDETFRTATGFIAPLIGGMGDYVELIKGASMGAMIAAGGAAVGMGTGAVAVADLAFGAVDNYFTAGWENEIGLENFTEEEKLQQAAMGAAFQVGGSALRRLGGKYIKPAWEKFVGDTAKELPGKAVKLDSKSPEANLEVNAKKIYRETADDYNAAPLGRTEIIESVIDKKADDLGNIAYSSKDDILINTKHDNMTNVYDKSGEVVGKVGQTRYKGQDVTIEMPSNIIINENDPAANIAVLRLYAESKKATLYTTDVDGNKVPLSGTDKFNAYTAGMIGENTVTATSNSAIEQSKRFQRYANYAVEEARAKNGGYLDPDDEAASKISIGIAERESIKRSIEDGIIAPLDREREAANVEFATLFADVLSDFQGNIINAVEAFDNGQYSRWFLDDLDPTVKINKTQKFIQGYGEVFNMTWADSKSKEMQYNGQALVETFGDIFKIDADSGEIKVSELFSKRTGGDLDDALIDLVINEHLSVEGGSYVNNLGMKNPDDVKVVVGSMMDADRFNGSVVKKLSEFANDDKISKVLQDSGFLSLDENGKPSLTLQGFLDGIKNLGKNIKDGVDVDESQRAMKLLFSKENSLFTKKDVSGNVIENVSVADTVLTQIKGTGTSYKAVQKALKPLEDAIIGSLGAINREISVYEKTRDLAKGVSDIKIATDLTNTIIADLMPDYRPGATKGISLKKMMDGAIGSDRAKVEATFKSKKFKDNIAQLRELNSKYGFLDDDSLFYDLDIDNLMNAEKQLKDNVKAQKDLFEVNSKASRDAIDGKMVEIEKSVATEIENVVNKGKNIYAETLAEVQESKRFELENNKEVARADQKSLRDSLQAEIEADLEAGELSKTEIGKKKRKLALLNKDMAEFDSKYDAMVEKAIKDLSSPRNKDVFPLVNERKSANQAELKILKDKAKSYANYKAELKKTVDNTIKAVKKITDIEDLKNLLDEDGNVKSIKTIVDSIKSIDPSKQEPRQASPKLPDVKVSTETTVSGKEFNSKWGVEPFLSDIKEFIGDPKFYDIMNDYQKYIVGEQVNVLKRRGFSDDQVKKFLNGDSAFTGNYEDLFKELGYSASYTSQGGANTTHVDLKKLSDLENVKKLHAEEMSKNAPSTKLSPEDSSLNLVDVELSKIMEELKTMSQIKDVKSLSADEAIQKVAQALSSVIDQSRNINEKALYNQSNVIKDIKKQYKVVQETIKANTKKDLTSVYEKKPVQDAINTLIEMARKAGLSDEVDKIIPQDLINFHGKILGDVKKSMDIGSILQPGERVNSANANRVGRNTLKMAKLSNVINQQALLGDKTMFNFAKKRQKRPDYKITALVKQLREGTPIEELGQIDYRDYIPESKRNVFENLYGIGKEFFGEVEGLDGEIRDLDINEFAIMYWSFLEDLGKTRSDVAKWEPNTKKTISQLIPYFKDEDAMVQFLTINDPEIGRAGYVKSNLEMIKNLQNVAEKASEYNAIGMSKESFLGIMKNQKSAAIRDAVDSLDVAPGESKSGSKISEYYSTYTETLENAFKDPAKSQIPKAIGGLFDIMTTNILFGSGTKEYTQTGLYHSLSRARYTGADLNVKEVHKEFWRNYPGMVLDTVKSTPYFIKEVINHIPQAWKIISGNMEMNKQLSKYPELKSRYKYVNEIIQRKIANSNANRHLQNTEGVMRMRRQGGDPRKKWAQGMKNLGDYYTETAFYLQQHNELNKSMLSHETAYAVMEIISKAGSMEEIKSNHVKSILKNTGVNEAMFKEIQEILIRNTDSDGSINLSFYETAKLREQLGMEDAQLGQAISNVYSAVFRREDILNKDNLYEITPRTLLNSIPMFLKRTVSGIAKQEVFEATHKLDNSGNYVNRVMAGIDEDGAMGAAKEIAKFANYAGTYVGLTGVAAVTGGSIAALWRSPMQAKRKIAESIGKIADKNDDEIDDTHPISMVGNALGEIYWEGLQALPARGAYLSGGNIAADKMSLFYRNYQQKINEDPNDTLTKFLDKMGVEDDSFTRNFFIGATFKTFADMTGGIRYFSGITELGLHQLKSTAEKEMFVQGEFGNIERNLKDSLNQQQFGKKAYMQLLKFNIDYMASHMGAVAYGMADGMRESEMLSDEEFKQMKNDAHYMMGVNEEVYDTMQGEQKEYGEGIIKALDLKDEYEKNEFKFAYSQQLLSGASHKDIAIDMIAGAENAPLIMTRGKKALTKSQEEVYKDLNKNFDASEEEVLRAIASTRSRDEAAQYAVEKFKPKSKEAKEMVRVKEDFSNTYARVGDALDIIDSVGEGLFSATYIQSKGIGKTPDQLTDSDKAQILMNDFYTPLKETVKNPEHLDKLFAVSVAVGSSYVENVYESKKGDVNATLDYIYAARMAQKDFNGDLRRLIDISKGDNSNDEFEAIRAQISKVSPEMIQKYMDEENMKKQSIMQPETLKEKGSTVNEIVNDFVAQEGYGDDATDVKTGALGMTEDRKRAIEAKVGRHLTDQEASELYVSEIYDKIEAINPNLSEDAKKTIISTLYNVGDGALKWKSFQKYMANPTDENLRNALFNSATIDGQTSKGLAKRRAEDYNKSNPETPIATVEQKANGDLNFYDANGQIVETVVAKKGKHKSSKEGVLEVPNGGDIVKKPVEAETLENVEPTQDRMVERTADAIEVTEFNPGSVPTPELDVSGLTADVEPVEMPEETVTTQNQPVTPQEPVVQEVQQNIQSQMAQGVGSETVIAAIKEKAMSIANISKEAVDKLSQSSVQVAQNIGDTSEETVAEAADYISTTSKQVAENVGDRAESIVETVSEIAEIVSEKIGDRLVRTKDSLSKVIENLSINGLTESANEIISLLRSATPEEVEEVMENPEMVFELTKEDVVPSDAPVKPVDINIPEAIKKFSERFKMNDKDEIVEVKQDDSSSELKSPVYDKVKMALGAVALMGKSAIDKISEVDIIPEAEVVEMEKLPEEEVEKTIFERIDSFVMDKIGGDTAEGLRKVGGSEKFLEMMAGEAAYRAMSLITPKSEEGLNKLAKMASKSAYKVIPESAVEKIVDMENLPEIAKLAIKELHEFNPESGQDRILDYLKSAGLKDAPNTTSWCAAFVSHLAKEAGLKVKPTAGALNFARLNKGKSDVSSAKPGDVLVQRHSDEGYTGHVNIILHKDDEKIIAIGGNQTDPSKPYEIGVVNYKVYSLKDLEEGKKAQIVSL